jgi:hypothetical protein
LGDITWLTRSPDHAVLDYFLSGFDKSKVEETKSANTDNLKQQVWECVLGFSKEMLQCYNSLPIAIAGVY